MELNDLIVRIKSIVIDMYKDEFNDLDFSGLDNYEPKFSCIGLVSGYSGGDCWGSIPERFTKELTKYKLEKLVENINVEILGIFGHNNVYWIYHDTSIDDGYYGNYEEYETITFDLEKLFNDTLKEKLKLFI